ncbi:MAG: phage baseplate assembly protein V [Lachnospiraceae bacterium]|nr:phage baseplate assembly protein V [Lachnospiraceae bacterium]
MAIFDIIEDVSRKQVEKTETGDSRIMGIMLGKVVKNYDKNMPGRVSVILLSREQGEGEGEEADNSRLLWARVVMHSSGSSWGHYFIPEIGDLVLVAFEQGNIERAYVIGCIAKTKDKILTTSINEKNQYKKIVTRNGNSIIFEDINEDQGGGAGGGGAAAGGGGAGGGAGGNPGDKDKITIKTANDSHRVVLNNEKKFIEVSDKEAKNFIKINTDEEKGHIEVKAAKKVTVKVGDNISLVMNGETGAVTLKAKKFTVEADESAGITSQGRAQFKGSNVTVEAGGNLKLSSSGLIEVAGTPIKLG